MSEISLLSSIVKAHFGIQERHSTQFEEYFACELETSLLAWKERESTFTFLEHSSSPADIEKALSLTRLLRRADKLIDEMTNLNESRKKEQKAPQKLHEEKKCASTYVTATTSSILHSQKEHI